MHGTHLFFVTWWMYVVAGQGQILLNPASTDATLVVVLMSSGVGSNVTMLVSYPTRSRYVDSTDENAGINTAASPPFVAIDSPFSSTVELNARRSIAKV